MSTRSLLHQAALSEWAIRFKDQKSSGLSVSEWCRLNNISRDKYFYWKRQLKEEVVSQALPDIVQLTMAPIPTSAPAPASSDEVCEDCTACTTFTPNSSARILIGEMTIEIDSSAPENFILSLVKAVRYA